MADERRCFCGNPIPKGRRRYCSNECAHLMECGVLTDSARLRDLELQRKTFGATLEEIRRDPKRLPRSADSGRRERMLNAWARLLGDWRREA